MVKYGHMFDGDITHVGNWSLVSFALRKDTKRIIENDILPDMVKFLEQILPQLRLKSAAKTICRKLP